MPKPHAAETLLIEGPDAMAFAQAQFSSNVNTLMPGHWQFSAWLDPQGHVRVLFHLVRLADDRLLLLLRGGSAALMHSALRPFVFRSKLTLTTPPPRALATGAALPLHGVQVDAQSCSLGCGTHSLKITSGNVGDDGWRLLQLREGWPWLPEQALNEMLAPALSLHRLQAVAIDKGCYPGQEIVARLHYRGGHKRHLHNANLSRAATAGEPLRIDARDCGRLLDVIVTATGIEALAVISDDAFAQATDGRLNALDDNLVISLGTCWPS